MNRMDRQELHLLARTFIDDRADVGSDVDEDEDEDDIDGITLLSM